MRGLLAEVWMVILPGINPCSGMLGVQTTAAEPPTHSQVLPLHAGKLTPALLCRRHSEIQSFVVMERTHVEL